MIAVGIVVVLILAVFLFALCRAAAKETPKP